MADNKKYYYLKLKDNFFDSDEIKLLESMHDGYLYSNILLRLYLKSLKNNGLLMFNELIPYSADMIAIVTGHNIGTVEKALSIFRDLKLIDVLDNGAIYMTDIQSFVGKSSTEADRKRLERQKFNQLKLEDKSRTNVGQMSDERSREIEIEIEIEKDIEIDIEKEDREKEKSSSSENYTLRDLYFEYEKTVGGTLSPFIIEDIEKLNKEDKFDLLVMREALHEMAISTVTPNLKYFIRILKRYKREGLNTVQLIRNSKNENLNKQNSNKQTNVPDWSKPDYDYVPSKEEMAYFDEQKTKMLKRLEKKS